MVSERKPMQSAAGWYVGREEDGFPYSRESGYYYSKWEVQRKLFPILTMSIAKEAMIEIKEEREMAKDCAEEADGMRKKLLVERMRFLDEALLALTQMQWPTEEWDYSIMC